MTTRQRERISTAEWVALGIVLVLALILRVYDIGQNGYGNMYYAAAVRSMAESWHNFFFAAYDPGGFITVDKPPVALWMQALSVRMFGFSGPALLLPQAVAGIASVLLLWHLVRRAFGKTAGFLAAALLAITPIAVVVDRSNVLDSWLVLTLLFAAWATIRATETRRLGPLLLATFWIGIGFNTKMLAAFILVPVLFVVWSLGTWGTRMPWRQRISQVLAAAVVLFCVSASWTLIVDTIPANQRPFIGGSSNNTVRDLALGYNGLGRIAGGQGPGGRPGGPHGRSPMMGQNGMRGPGVRGRGGMGPGGGHGGPGGPGGLMFGGDPGITRLFIPGMGEQALFLFPLALVGIVLPFLRKAESRDSESNGVTERITAGLFGGWLLLYGGIFSFAQGVFHPYYMVALAPAIAALSAIGLVQLASRIVAGRPSWRFVAIAVGLVTVLWEASLVQPVGGTLGATLLILLAVALVAAIVFAIFGGRMLGSATHLAVGGIAALLLCSPSVYLSGRMATRPGNGMIPMATLTQEGMGGPGGPPGGGFPGGPMQGGMMPMMGPDGGGTPPPGMPPMGGTFGGPMMGGGGPRGPGGPGGPGMGGKISEQDKQLASFLEAHRGKAKYLVATASSNEAGPIILLTGKPVMAMGGFNGGDSAITLDQFKAMVAAGEVRYVLMGGMGGPGGPPGGGGFPGGPMAGGMPPQGMPPMGGGPGGPMFGGGGPGGPGGPGRGRAISAIFDWVKEHGTQVDYTGEGIGDDVDDMGFPPRMRGGQLYEVR